MKRFVSIILLASMLLAFAACSGKKPGGGFDPEGYKDLLDCAIRLPSEFSEELVKQVIHPGEYAFHADYYKENKGEDYLALLQAEFAKIAQSYAETFGEDWKLSYKINEAQVKDEKGIENYKNFDSFYFKTYNVDVDRIQSVVFAKVTVSIEGSLDSNSKDKTVQCFCIDGKWYSFYAVRLGVNLNSPAQGN